jgi:putative pyrroloquinoline-quinone binding quinoprotein
MAAMAVIVACAVAACGSSMEDRTAGASSGASPTAAATESAPGAFPSTTSPSPATVPEGAVTTVAPFETLSTTALGGPAALTVLGADGQVRWEAAPVAGFVGATQAAIGDGVLLAATICDGPVAVRAWDLESGAPLWSAVLPDSQGGGAALEVADGLAVATVAGGVWAFDGRTGELRPGVATASSATDPAVLPGPAGGPLATAEGVSVTSPGCPTPG